MYGQEAPDMGSLANKDSWTFNVVILSHPVEFKRDLSEFWYICPTVL